MSEGQDKTVKEWCKHITWQFIGSHSHGGGMGWMIKNAPEFAPTFVDVNWTCCPICGVSNPDPSAQGPVETMPAETNKFSVETALADYNRTYANELQEANDKAMQLEKEGDMYGWNFFKGIASGLTSRDIIAYNLKKLVEKQAGHIERIAKH